MSPIFRSLFSFAGKPFPKERLSFDLSLYLVANRSSFPDENQFFSKILASVQGGVTCVQLRDFESDFSTTVRIATRLKHLLKDIPLFINTRNSLEVLQSVGAEGVYLEEKYPYGEARRLLGNKAIIGIPVKTMKEVLDLEDTRAIDYLSVKIFPSKRTCPKNDSVWGLEGLRNVRAVSTHKIVAIGGLNVDSTKNLVNELNLDDGIAMASGLMQEIDPCLTAQKIQDFLKKERGVL